MAKKSDYSLFINFFSNSLKNRIIHYFRPPLFTIHYFWAHYSLFILKKGHYSLIIIPHPDPLISTHRFLDKQGLSCVRLDFVEKKRQLSCCLSVVLYSKYIIANHFRPGLWWSEASSLCCLCFVCLIHLILFVPVNNYSDMLGQVFLGEPVLSKAQGHNKVTLVRLQQSHCAP